MTRRVLIYKRFERFWHWMQALLIGLLAYSGFEVHYGWGFMDFEGAVALHKLFAWAFVGLITFAIFWHTTTGEWKQYIPRTGHTRDMIRFYMSGIFKGAPHPVKKTELSKLNPLQRLAYLSLKLVLIPSLVISGFLYYYYNDWALIGMEGMPLGPVAIFHTFMAFAMIAFVLVHVYLTTTGHTVTSNIKAMVSGYEDLEDDE